DEARLKKEEQRINQESAGKADADRTATLSQEFKVPDMTVQNLRATNNWGSVTVELAMAQKLTAQDPATYPTIDTAIAKIDSLRGQSQSWGQISQALSLNLGPVLSQTQHIRHVMNIGDQKVDQASVRDAKKKKSAPR